MPSQHQHGELQHQVTNEGLLSGPNRQLTQDRGRIANDGEISKTAEWIENAADTARQYDNLPHNDFTIIWV
jgi:hypothetical protein